MEEPKSSEDVPATSCVAKKKGAPQKAKKKNILFDHTPFFPLASHFQLAFVGKRKNNNIIIIIKKNGSPTLFRWLEALHLGDLMRLWVRPGGNTIAVPQVFMGRWGASRTPRRLGRPASRPALSPGEPIPGPSGRVPRRTRATVREEREPSSGPPPASLGSLALPRRSVPRRRFGDLDPIPFRPRARPPLPLARGPGCEAPPPPLRETEGHAIARLLNGIYPMP